MGHEYYLIFLILAILCFVIKAQPLKNSLGFKAILTVIVLVQFYTGCYFLSNSLIDDERNFITALRDRTPDDRQDENRDMANYINGLPDNSKILIDDAIAYPIVAFTNDVANLTMPYQENFLSAIETPGQYVGYILIANSKNTLAGYSVLNAHYAPVMYQSGNNYSTLQKAYETEHWTLYKLY